MDNHMRHTIVGLHSCGRIPRGRSLVGLVWDLGIGACLASGPVGGWCV